MNKLDIIKQSYSECSKQIGGIEIVSEQDAISILHECLDNKTIILGMDGFFMEDGKIRPSMEDSIDFTTDNRLPSNNDIRAAISFVNARAGRWMYFEIVF